MDGGRRPGFSGKTAAAAAVRSEDFRGPRIFPGGRGFETSANSLLKAFSKPLPWSAYRTISEPLKLDFRRAPRGHGITPGARLEACFKGFGNTVRGRDANGLLKFPYVPQYS